MMLEKIYLCGISGTPPRNEIRKASLGAEESVPWAYFKNTADILQEKKAAGYEIIALEQTDDSENLGDFQFNFPTCLIIGHEFHGISDDLLEYVDSAVEIPMFGIKASLNVSVAFGITAFEMVKQYLRSKH